MVKILTGWSNKGGSTFAFVNLTNELNKNGIDTVLYGPHDWHLDKCKSDKSSNLKLNPDDILICHFVNFSLRPNVKQVILFCHEKNLYEVGKIKPFWDIAIFLNKKHKKYHKNYNGSYRIIPNLKESIKIYEKSPESVGVAGIVGSIDHNKQTHLSIERAKKDGYKKIILFGNVTDPQYYNNQVKPLIDNTQVIEYGFISDKEKMYNMVECVYLSSKSEVASLVKDECETTNTIFKGNDDTEHDGLSLTNEEIINKWKEVLNL
jgi:hypothetical protein